MAIRPLSKFKMPTGTRDEAWLSKATSIRMVLASLWRKLREDLTMIWRQAAHLEVDIEVLRAMLSQYEMTEQLYVGLLKSSVLSLLLTVSVGLITSL